MKPIRYSSVCLGLLALAGPATAQTAPAAPAPVDVEEPVKLAEFAVTASQDRGYLSTHSVGGTRTNTALKDIPQKITIVNSELLADTASVSLSDALRFVSNVHSANNTRNDSFRIRGLESGEATINGFNVNTGSPNDLTHIDRVEVVKGPAGVLYGTGRFGGVINLVRKRPQAKAAYEVRTQYSSTDLVRAEADFTGPLYRGKNVQLAYRLTASVADGSEFFDHSQWRHFSISPSLELKIGDRTTVTAYWEFLDETRSNFWGDHLQRDAAGAFTVFLHPDRRVNFRPGSTRDNNHDIYSIEAQHRVNDQLTLRLGSFAYEGGSWDQGGGGHRLLADNRTLHNYYDHQVFNRERMRTQLDALAKFKLGPTSHHALVGLEWTHISWGSSENWQPSAQAQNRNANPWQIIDLLNPRATPPRDGSYASLVDPVKVRNDVPPRERAGFDKPTNYYFQDQLKAFGDRLVITAGLRWDKITNTVVNPFTNAVESNVQERWSPRYGFVFHLTPAVGIYAIQSEGFQPQTGYDFYTGKPISPTTGGVKEAGLKLNLFGGKVVGTISAFEQTQEDIVTTVFNTERGTFESAGRTQGGTWKSKGYELDFVISPTEDWQILASFGVCDPRVVADTDPRNVGKRFENAPDMTWGLWNKYAPSRGPLAGWALAVGAKHSDEKAGDRANTFFVPGYERVDLFLSYRVTKNLTLAANVNNLLDKYYYAEARAYRDLIFGAPREIILSATARF